MMSDEKLISVIIPVYNISDYIGKCIESIINQTYSKLEIIVVDDGSTDGSGEICEQYAMQDNRIIVLHKENGGLADARNYALDRAGGDLIGFVDGDDWIHPQMYELMKEVMDLKKADVVTCDFERQDYRFCQEVININSCEVRLITGTEALIDIETPLVVAWNKLYRREIFEDIRYPKGRLHEDEFIIHDIFYRCRSVAVIEKRLYFYTEREGSIVAQMTPKRIKDALDALESRIIFAREHNWNDVMPAVVQRYCDYCMDRYDEVKRGIYKRLGTEYLDLLWESDKRILKEYDFVEIDRKYRLFAKSPQQYERWISQNNCIIRYRNRLKIIFTKIIRVIGNSK